MSFRLAVFLSSRLRHGTLALALSSGIADVVTTAVGQERFTREVPTTLRMPADSSTLDYKVAPAFGGLFFDQPVHVIYAPGETQRAFVVERTGRIAVVRDTAAPTRDVFLDISTRIGTPTPDHGLISVVFHPRFAENGYFYAWFSIYVNGQRANRLARFSVSATNPAVADAASETPLITQLTGPGGHDGGTLLFGPDGYLYLSLGDGDRNLPEIDAANQRIDRGFFGAVIRLDVDQRVGSLPPNAHPSVHAGTYLVPPDNPFVGATSFNGQSVTASAVRTEFWAVGLRNPWRMAFDSATGQLWCADVGLSTREEINLITRGSNYGWDYREGLTGGPRASNLPAGLTLTHPIWDYPTSQGLSITGGIVYRGSKYTDLAGRYLFADWVSGRIWTLEDNGARPLPATQIRQIASEPGLTGFTLDPRTGDILLADFDSNQIKRLVPNPNAGGSPLPATLSETGIFSDLAKLTPAKGVEPYAVNAPFWSDRAEKSRWFAMPDGTSVFRFSADGNWALPTGTVWVKHFSTRTNTGRFPPFIRLETRVLVKTADGVYGATYRWNDAQTEATLVPEQGGFRTYTFYGDSGAPETRNWTFPSRNDCLTCHTEKGGHALGFNTRQLNRGAMTTTQENQLVTLSQAGYLDTAISSGAAGSLPALVDHTVQRDSLEKRARSYLDVNCSQCHQPGGTAVGGWDARAATPLSLAHIVEGPLSRPAPAGARVLVPGSTANSHLLQRMIDNGVPRMPPIGTNTRDTNGESLIAEWIADLARPRPASRLLNVAARAHVGTGENVLIPGFVIAGAPKSVLVRAVGPTLGAFGVPDTLSAPVLTMYDDKQRIIASNTGWTNVADPTTVRAAALRVGAFALGDSSTDSALLVTLSPGAYSAQTSGVAGTTGVALVEVYDADTGGAGRLINTAIRGRVGTGANILIPGLVVSEGAAKRVLIRAIGPGLTAFGVPGALARPVVTLFHGRLAYLTNTGWNTASNAAEIRTTAQAVGAFALAAGSADSAILATLSPGAYSVQVSGVADATGVALVEIYEVP